MFLLVGEEVEVISKYIRIFNMYCFNFKHFSPYTNFRTYHFTQQHSFAARTGALRGGFHATESQASRRAPWGPQDPLPAG